MTDHPGTLRGKRLRAVRCRHRGLAAPRAAAAAARRVLQALVVARHLRLVARPFVDAHRRARATVHERQARRAHEHARRGGAAVRAAGGLVAFAQ